MILTNQSQLSSRLRQVLNLSCLKFKNLLSHCVLTWEMCAIQTHSSARENSLWVKNFTQVWLRTFKSMERLRILKLESWSQIWARLQRSTCVPRTKFTRKNTWQQQVKTLCTYSSRRIIWPLSMSNRLNLCNLLLSFKLGSKIVNLAMFWPVSHNLDKAQLQTGVLV